MNTLTKELRRLREQDPEIASVLDSYEQIDLIYSQSLEAMGVVSKQSATVRNSAEVTLSLSPTAYNHKIK